jgi:spermidine/putrescine-binding protein
MKYESNTTEVIMKSGDAWIAQTWNGAIQKVCESDPKFKLCIPREGILFFFDNFAILSSSSNKKSAELFINFMLRPENSAANMKKIKYAMPNEAARALLDSALRTNPVVFPILPESSKIETIRDWGEFNKLLDKAWTELKVK